ncbi:MAG: flagellar biosynthesis anti-sigma factor FlgM [Gammaproteobacteria bacterium]|nr:flagellar biosynthesis anti-sigma factor FlgM [Gammaproteobacteria bacterium]
MANDINGINSGRTPQADEKQIQTLRRESASNTPSRSTANRSASPGQDKVSLTDMAARLKSLEQKLAEQPDVDQARVDKVRTAMAKGEYRVDPERVADKMMNFESNF